MRYLDVRGRLNNDSILIYHGDMYTGYTYTDVLLTVFDFLEENPSETIVMRLKEEGRGYGNNSRTFEEAFLYYLRDSPATAKGAKEHFHKPEALKPYPTLGELRGKIFLLQNFPSALEGPYGIIWESKDMVLEDLWIIPSVDHLWMKWDAIEEALKRAATAEEDNQALHLSHLSAAVGLLPIEAAAGPLNGTVFGMNDRTGDWLTRQVRRGDKYYGKTGVVIVDFPGQKIVDAILERNAGLIGGGAEL
jgi:1-phosphatidylinositol phosphodiesterase